MSSTGIAFVDLRRQYATVSQELGAEALTVLRSCNYISGAKMNAFMKGIATGLHDPTPLHLQPAYASLGYKNGDFPRTERCASRILSLPMFPELTRDVIALICKEIKNFYGAHT
jgi:hypothetical protein